MKTSVKDLLLGAVANVKSNRPRLVCSTECRIWPTLHFLFVLVLSTEESITILEYVL